MLKLSILVLFLILKEKFSVFKNSLIILDALFQPTYICLHCLPKIKESICPTSPRKVFSPFGVQFCWLFYNLWKHNNFVDYLTFSPLYMMRNTFEAFHSLLGSRIPSLFFFLFYAENYPIAIDLILDSNLCLELAAYQGLERSHFFGLYYSISFNIQLELFFPLFWALFF